MLRFKATDGDIVRVISDLCRVLLLGPNESFRKANGGVSLDSSNDFFLHDEGDNEYTLDCRYAHQRENLEAVGVILEWRGLYKVIDGKPKKGTK